MAEVLLVHRPGAGYDDWTFPKGKLFLGEDPLAGALREVEEETGFQCKVLRYFDRTSYIDRKERPKVVDYWIMEPVAGRFRPSQEVDEARWLTVDEALEVLTFPRDRELLGQFAGITYRRLTRA